MTESTAPAQAADPLALARFKLRIGRRPSVWTELFDTARRSFWWLLADLVLMALAWQMGATSTVLVGAAAALAPFAVAAWGWRRVGRHRQMLCAWAVGDWSAVRRLSQALRADGPPSSLLHFDLDVRLASIEARGGELAAGLRRVAPWREKLAKAPGLFESRAATVYSAAGDMPRFVQLMGEAYELSKHDAARGLDYALAHARFGDADQAGALIDATDRSALQPSAGAFVDWARGLVQERRGEAEALGSLGAAVDAFIQRADEPVVWTSLAFAAADHALALNRAGHAERAEARGQEQAQAQAQIANVWPVLKPHAHAALLRTLRDEGLLPESAPEPKV